jgi:hypothetical protein
MRADDHVRQLCPNFLSLKHLAYKDANLSVMKIWRLTESAGPAERKMMVRRITMEFGSKAVL